MVLKRGKDTTNKRTAEIALEALGDLKRLDNTTITTHIMKDERNRKKHKEL